MAAWIGVLWLTVRMVTSGEERPMEGHELITKLTMATVLAMFPLAALSQNAPHVVLPPNVVSRVQAGSRIDVSPANVTKVQPSTRGAGPHFSISQSRVNLAGSNPARSNDTNVQPVQVRSRQFRVSPPTFGPTGAGRPLEGNRPSAREEASRSGAGTVRQAAAGAPAITADMPLGDIARYLRSIGTNTLNTGEAPAP